MLKVIETAPTNLAEELVEDIRHDIEGWVSWMSYADMTENYLRERRKDLLTLCDIIERRLS